MLSRSEIGINLIVKEFYLCLMEKPGNKSNLQQMKKRNLSVVDRKISAEIKIKFQIRYLYLHLTISSSSDSL